MTTGRAVTGRLVTVSGIDGSGKSMLVEGLVRRIADAGVEAVAVRPMHRDPDFIRSLAGTRQLMPHDERWARDVEAFIGRYTCWVMAANVCDVVIPALARGAVVVADRWIADHVTSQHWFGVTLDADEPPLAQLPMPDLELLVDISPATAQRRIDTRGPKGSQGSGLPFLSFFRQALLSWYENRPHITIDGEAPAGEALDTAVIAVREHMAESERTWPA